MNHWVFEYNDKGHPIRIHGPFATGTEGIQWATNHMEMGTWDLSWVSTPRDALSRVTVTRLP